MSSSDFGPLDIIRAAQWLPLEAPEKAVLIAMVTNERMTHATWTGNPSVPALAMASGYKHRRVQIALGTLGNSRLITRVDRAEGGAGASGWRIEAFRIMAAAQAIRASGACGVHGVEGCTTCTGAPHAPASVDASVMHDHTHTPTGAGAHHAPVHHMHPSVAEPQKPPHVPNFDKPTILPPPEQLADRGAFVARWNLHAEAFYPGQPSQRWEATTLAARRGHGAGFFTSAKEDAREQPMLEHGDHLLPMLDRYAAVCRGEYGERRPFERRDFEAPRMLAALRLWVTTGTAPFWARPAARPEPPRFAGPAVELLDNDWLLEAARQEGGGT